MAPDLQDAWTRGHEVVRYSRRGLDGRHEMLIDDDPNLPEGEYMRIS
jgi:hypothetical protein